MEQKSADCISALTTSAFQLAAAICCPIVGTVASIASPIIQHVMNRSLSKFVRPDSPEIDKSRLGFAYIAFCDYVSKQEKIGSKIRDDSFFNPPHEYSIADETIESVCRCVIQDKENAKATAYGRILGSFMFQSNLQNSQIVHIVDSMYSLSMDDLEVLCCFSDGATYHLLKLDSDVQSSSMFGAHILCRCLLHLQALGLIVRVPPVSMPYQIQNHRLTPLGKYISQCVSEIVNHTYLGMLFYHYSSK